MRCCLLLVTFVVFVVFVVPSWSHSQICVLARAGSPATAGDGKPVRSSWTGSVQSWRSRGSSVSLPASLPFLTRLPLLASLALLPAVPLQAGDAVQSSQAVLPWLPLLTQQSRLSLQSCDLYFRFFLSPGTFLNCPKQSCSVWIPFITKQNFARMGNDKRRKRIS